MYVLGIECTAHTISAGVFNDKVLSNVIKTHPFTKKGLIPRSLADHHSKYFSEVLYSALSKANISIRDVNLIAVSQGPGIGAPLSVGMSAAKFLSKYYEIPIVGVNHPFAHVKISEFRTGFSSPLILYLSGANSQILLEDHFDFSVLGETLDIGIGNLFDSFARTLSLEPAHGGILSKLAEKGSYIELPYTVKGLNLVFSGIFTAAKQALKNNPKEDVAYSLMETVFSMCCEVVERALFLTEKDSLVVCGGVAQNRRLQKMLSLMCEDIGVRFGVAEDEFNRDNGAMIAYAGKLIYDEFGSSNVEKLAPNPKWRIDSLKDQIVKNA